MVGAAPAKLTAALPPGAAPPAVGLPAAFGRFSVTSAPEPSKARRQARTKSLFSRRKDQPAEARAASWLSAIGTILKRKRAASAPGPADPKPPVQLHDFGPVPPPTPAWVNAAAWDAYASLAARSEAKRR
ncbi:hypothetical protein Q8F55_005924 [Vanrija albida]|uniref:Uncharacterized protein n=1 Tax=Vanrija albida TaxID=181172 RepID=A0ABR3Q379_9TREE